MIRDTCPCGAEFEVDHATAAIPSSSEQNAHKQWLEAHSDCRVKIEITGVPVDFTEHEIAENEGRNPVENNLAKRRWVWHARNKRGLSDGGL